MPTDLTSIVAAAVESAKDGETDTSGAPDASNTEGSAEGGTSDAHADNGTEAAASVAGEGTPEAAAPPEPDEVEREMAEFGIQLKPLVPGKRENAIPQSRVKQMTEKMRAKLVTAHQQEIKAREDRIAAAEQARQELIQMAIKDPEQNLRQLMEVNPAYRDAIQKILGVAAETAPAVPAGDPMPQPDATFPDGSTGYSQEGMGKLLEWNARRAEERAYKRYQADADKRFGPIQREWQVQKAFEAQVPKLRERVAKAEALWGADRMKKHEAEITAKLQASGNPTEHWEQIVAEVMVPKLAAERTAMREEIIKEMKAAPAAAAKGVPAATSADSNAGPRSIEQVIKDKLTEAGLR
jgi:hypothetical protein